MPVFYIKFDVYGLKFKRPIFGLECDYTSEQLDKIRKRLIQDTKEKLLAAGYCK